MDEIDALDVEANAVLGTIVRLPNAGEGEVA